MIMGWSIIIRSIQEGFWASISWIHSKLFLERDLSSSSKIFMILRPWVEFSVVGERYERNWDPRRNNSCMWLQNVYDMWMQRMCEAGVTADTVRSKYKMKGMKFIKILHISSFGDNVKGHPWDRRNISEIFM